MPRYFDDYKPFHNIFCNGCGKDPIYGNRYKCLQCYDLHLCEQCYTNNKFGKQQTENNQHNENHAMQLFMSVLDQKSTHHHIIKCNGCQTEKYPGKRYCCNVCKDYNLCQRCYDDNQRIPGDNNAFGGHNSKHEMTVFDFEADEHNDNETWKAMTIKMQNHFGNLLGRKAWIQYNVTDEQEWTNFAKNIAYAIYGPPTIIPHNAADTTTATSVKEKEKSKEKICEFGYSSKQEKHIKELRLHIQKLKKDTPDDIIFMNIIFVSFWSYKLESMLPLIRIFRDKPCQSYFVEPEGRTYESWEDFLDKNLLPKCEICYPSMGWYQPDENGYSLLEFNKSADCDTNRKLVKKGDKAATIVGGGGVVLGVIGLFTPLAPVAAHALVASVVTTGIYGTARAGYKLRDRSKHGQSVNPFASKESFHNWMAIIGSTVAIQTHGLPFLQINRGKKIKKSVLLNMKNTSISSGNSTNDAFIMGYVMNNIIEKYQSEKEIPEIEYFQLCAFVLFFTNTSISMEKAENIIKNAQHTVFDQLTDKLNNTHL